MALPEMRRKNYLAYLLRMWQESEEDGIVWRISLESPHTGERQGFTGLKALFDFLKQRAEQGPRSSGPAAQPVPTQAESGSQDATMVESNQPAGSLPSES